MKGLQYLSSSYRDPAGFLFNRQGQIFRYIAPAYFKNYDYLIASGLYETLATAGRLVSHVEKDPSDFAVAPGEGRILFPEQIPFISYPYEWSFNMWKDAAVVTLKVATIALEKGMILKDATPFNIQFFKGRPVFIDTLSFEQYEEGSSWIAYRQFCECFLGPLLLMHYGHRDMGKLFLAYPDGISMDMVKALLPIKAKWNLHVFLHVWLQSRVTGKQHQKKIPTRNFSKRKLQTLLRGLTSLVNGLKEKQLTSEWKHYYTDTILSDAYLSEKKSLFAQFIKDIPFETVIDLGSNEGMFTLMLKDRATHIVAMDLDSNCIDALYRFIRQDKIKNIVPLVSKLHQPSPAIGWANEERLSFTQRLKADLVLALALVHHLAISSNVSLEQIAKWLHGMGGCIIIEFVPKSDEKVQLLLQNRKDVFSSYTEENFRLAFHKYFRITREEPIAGTGRILFLMNRI